MNRKIFLTSAFLVIALICLISIGLILLFPSRNLSDSILWQTYTNKEMDISFEYPSGWKAQGTIDEVYIDPKQTLLTKLHADSFGENNGSYVIFLIPPKGELIEAYFDNSIRLDSKEKLLNAKEHAESAKESADYDYRSFWAYMGNGKEQGYSDFRMISGPLLWGDYFKNNLISLEGFYREKDDMIGMRQEGCNFKDPKTREQNVSRCRAIFEHVLGSIKFLKP